MEFLDPSPEALSDSSNNFKKKYDFPFDEVPIGKSFMVQINEISSVEVLRATASRKGITLKKKFKVINHKNCYEVFRKE